MGCKPILEHHRRVVTALTLTLGVNGPLVDLLMDWEYPFSTNTIQNAVCHDILNVIKRAL